MGRFFILAWALVCMVWGLYACGSTTTSSTTTTSSDATEVDADNCNRGATPTSVSASLGKASSTDPEVPGLTLCVFNAIYTDTFSEAYADNPKAAKGTTPYLFYTYGNLAQAYKNLFVTQTAYTTPFNNGNSFSNNREFAAFFANINQETNGAAPPTFLENGNFTTTGAGSMGAAYGLTAINEGSCATSGCPAYGTKKGFCESTDPTAKLSACNGIPTTPDGTDYCSLAVRFCNEGNYPANTPSYQFFGRGSKQLTHAYNYIFYGSRIAPSDPLNLANNPSLVGSGGVTGWAVGLAYWAIQFQEPNNTLKPSMHDGFFNPTTGSVSEAFNLETGFGKTINIINGGVECGITRQFIQTTTLNRINNYLELLLRLDPDMPINRVEVTKGDGSVDTYTVENLKSNIKTKNPLNPTYDPYAENASQLVKFYKTNSVPKSANYSSIEPAWTMQWGGNGRYNSAPLIQEYYFAADTPGAAATNVYNNGSTNLTKIMLYYDANPAGLTQERLDCAGVPDYSGN